MSYSSRFLWFLLRGLGIAEGRGICVLALVCITCDGCSNRDQEAIHLTGPSKRFEVQLEGNFSSPLVFGRSVVRATVLRSAGPRTGPFQVYDADFLDDGFTHQFPGHAWLSADTLRLTRTLHPDPSQSSAVTVQNATKERIACLTLLSDDLIFMFDVEPGTQRAFQMYVPAGSRPCLDVTWRRNDGAVVARSNKCFGVIGNRLASPTVLLTQEEIRLQEVK